MPATSAGMTAARLSAILLHPPSAKVQSIMKAILLLLGIVFIVVAGVYFVVPADQLPSFMPGHEAGVMRVHMKHGVLAGAIGVVLIVAGWVMGRR